MKVQFRVLLTTFLFLLTTSSMVGAIDILYVALDNDTVVKYDSTGNNGTTIAATKTVFAISTYLFLPSGLAFDSSGNLFVSNLDNRIVKYNSAGVYQSQINSNLITPESLAFDSSGTLYATNSGIPYSVSKFNASGGFLGEITTNLQSPKGIAFNSTGDMYVSGNGVYEIKRFDAAGNYLGEFGNSSEVASTNGIAFDSSGYLYVASKGSNEIAIFNAANVYQRSISTNLNEPYGLAFDSSGNLYVSNKGNKTISKFDPTGNFLTSWSTGSSPYYMAFQPVPEPSTYALAAIATGVMAAVARRRKARKA